MGAEGPGTTGEDGPELDTWPEAPVKVDGTVGVATTVVRGELVGLVNGRRGCFTATGTGVVEILRASGAAVRTGRAIGAIGVGGAVGGTVTSCWLGEIADCTIVGKHVGNCNGKLVGKIDEVGDDND